MTSRALVRPISRPIVRANPRQIAAVAAPPPSNFLDSVVSNMELELDMSTDQGQRILNRIASPDSGEPQANHDMFLGTTAAVESNDPTFDTDRYDFDGGDEFTTVISGNTDWMDTLGFSNQPVTGVIIFDIGSTLANGDLFFGHGLSTNLRFQCQTRSNGDIRCTQDSGGTPGVITVPIGMATSTTDNILIVSFDYASSEVLIWFNSKTPITTSFTPDTTNTATTTEEFAIGNAQSGGANFLPSGFSMSLFAFRNNFSNDTQAEAMIDNLSGRGLIAPIA